MKTIISKIAQLPTFIQVAAGPLLILIISLLAPTCSKQPIPDNRQIDTVYVERIKLIEVEKPVYPNKVEEAKRIDSLVAIELSKRKREIIGFEKKTVSKPFKKNQSFLVVQYLEKDSIDLSRSTLQQESFEILPDDNFKMDYKGNFEVNTKNRKWRIFKAKVNTAFRILEKPVLIGVGIAIGVAASK